MADGESASYRLHQLEETSRDHERRIRENREMLMALPYLTEDVGEIKRACQEIRKWVEEREQARLREEREKETLSAGQKVAIISGAFVVVASLITAVATLINAGAV